MRVSGFQTGRRSYALVQGCLPLFGFFGLGLVRASGRASGQESEGVERVLSWAAYTDFVTVACLVPK